MNRKEQWKVRLDVVFRDVKPENIVLDANMPRSQRYGQMLIDAEVSVILMDVGH